MSVETPRRPSFVELLRASLLVCAAGAVLVAIVWYCFRNLRL
jgi:hypothetical protein